MTDQLAKVVHFKPATLKMTFMVWTGIMPVLMIPLVVAWFAFLLAVGVGVCSTIGAVAPLFGLKIALIGALGLLVMSGLIGSGLLITALTGDDQIHINKDGITFPLFMSPYLRFRRKRLWSEVGKVFFQKYDPSIANYGDIVMIFRSGERINLEVSGFVDLNLEGFQKGELEKFLLACEVLATDAEVTTDVAQLRDVLNNETREQGKLSYTEIWENELANRFHATVFVPLEPEKQLQNGRLKVVRQLAFGGLAAVYLAQKDGRELVILKEAVIPANQDEAIKAKALEMFQREARFLAALEHPRIARVLDHFVEEGRNYLLLQRISGQTLRQIVNQQGAQPEPVVLKWCTEIAEILVFLHSQNPPVIHRDLTPENLILADSGHVHLIDFGAANEFLGTVTGTVVGKQAFIAPEQFRGKASLSSDIYSFGGTMHFLLTGKNPLAMSELRPKSIDSKISDDADQLVQSCSCQETAGRPASAEALLNRLKGLRSKAVSVQ